jgi:NADPH:quinone reductase-like Zn-dependent oxidoreductase
MQITEIQVPRAAFNAAQVVTRAVPDLGAGEVLVRVERFALTANNISYALSGDMIGYWNFYPAPAPMGIVPVWGFAEVVQSNNADLTPGERVWGFLPMASHAVLTPKAVSARTALDQTAHRQSLPSLYNVYSRTALDPAELEALADERCVLFPLFTTSYLLWDYLVDNAYFGIEQILVTSASSKTGLGLLNLLARAPGPKPKIIALTSAENTAFVQGLNISDEVASYENIANLNGDLATGFVDMAGNADVVGAIYERFGAQLKLACAVGATHWGAKRFRGSELGAPYTFFFAPSQVAKRDEEWGVGEIMRRAQGECMRITSEMKSALEIQTLHGAAAIVEAYGQLAANKVSPRIGLMGRFS